MKRTLIAVLTIGLLSACVGVTTPGASKSETPNQSLTATGTAMSKVETVQFAATGTITLTLPQQVVIQIEPKAGSLGSLLGPTTTVHFAVTGAAKRPDQLHASVSATIGGMTITTEVIASGGRLYYTDPMTQKWRLAANHSTSDSPSKAPSKLGSTLYQKLLDTATTLTEVTANPSNLDGVGVDQYHIVPNLAKLFAELENGQTPKNPQASSVLQQLLQNAAVSADVWTGTNDHLVRRLSYKADVTADLSQLASAFGSIARSSAAQPFTIPAGSNAHLTAQVELNLHDYNRSVTITEPTITP